jgi:hypothetical protein
MPSCPRPGRWESLGDFIILAVGAAILAAEWACIVSVAASLA